MFQINRAKFPHTVFSQPCWALVNVRREVNLATMRVPAQIRSAIPVVTTVMFGFSALMVSRSYGDLRSTLSTCCASSAARDPAPLSCRSVHSSDSTKKSATFFHYLACCFCDAGQLMRALWTIRRRLFFAGAPNRIAPIVMSVGCEQAPEVQHIST
jgi:hypothetical protein